MWQKTGDSEVGSFRNFNLKTSTLTPWVNSSTNEYISGRVSGLAIIYSNDDNFRISTTQDGNFVGKYIESNVKQTSLGMNEVIIVSSIENITNNYLPPLLGYKSVSSERVIILETWLVNGVGAVYSKHEEKRSMFFDGIEEEQPTVITEHFLHAKPTKAVPKSFERLNPTEPQKYSWTWNGAFPWVYNSATDSWFYYLFSGNSYNAYDARSGSWFTFDSGTGAWNPSN
jgi:hypothetical protein